MKRFILTALAFVCLLGTANAQLLDGFKRYAVAGNDTVITYIANLQGSDDHAVYVAFDTSSGGSGGVAPTYTMTITPVLKTTSGADSTFTFYYNGTVNSAQTITSTDTPADSARVWSISPTVVPLAHMKITITVTGLSGQWSIYTGYVGRKNKE